MAKAPENYKAICAGIVDLLQTTRQTAARSINSLMTATYWEIGRRIAKFEQRGETRASYGEQPIELSSSRTRTCRNNLVAGLVEQTSGNFYLGLTHFVLRFKYVPWFSPEHR